MLKRLALRNVVIVAELEIELGAGFTALTGETGAGKSILIDALQLALGHRADAALVREGAARAEVSAEFDSPPGLAPWLDEAGFANPGANDGLLLRRTVDAQGKSRAWINGSSATVAQLREVAEYLVDIHGQHAWQSLTRPAAVRALLDARAGLDGLALAALWASWRQAQQALAHARGQGHTLEQERERLAWQITELSKLAPAENEWPQLNAEHQRLAHGQALLDGCRAALQALSNSERASETAPELGATALLSQAIDAVDGVARFDVDLQAVAEVLKSAQAQLEDAAHTLHSYLGRHDPNPERLAELDARLGQWVALGRRYRRAPAELPALLQGWRDELRGLDAAADLNALEQACESAEAAWRKEAQRVGQARQRAAPGLAKSVTQVMQKLGLAGGVFEVALVALDEPQAFGLQNVEFRVAGHAGSTPRVLAKVASGGELSRLALAIAVSTVTNSAANSPNSAGASMPTLIFDEIDAGVGGTVADSVGRLMKQLGRSAQVLAVTHLAQVAACADAHLVVSKALQGSQTVSAITPVAGELRVAEIARMLGGERLAGTSQAHAKALLRGAVADGVSNE